MSDLYLDPDSHDIVVTGNDLSLTTGSGATIQRVKQALLAFDNEWFLDLSDGIPYYEDILVKNPNPQVVEGLLQDAVLNVAGVLELTYFSLDYVGETRSLTLSCGIRTNEDQIDFTQVLGGS